MQSLGILHPYVLFLLFGVVAGAMLALFFFILDLLIAYNLL